VRFPAKAVADPRSYNPLQRIAYLVVIFLLVPAIIWTGLAMSPGFTAIAPATVTLLGGKQSARTLHFVLSIALTVFLIVHLGMLVLAGFTTRTRAMITGRSEGRR
jgi:thiosulfate reductase cytochrome b subunit